MYFFSDIAICREEVKVVTQPANQVKFLGVPHPGFLLNRIALRGV